MPYGGPYGSDYGGDPTLAGTASTLGRVFEIDPDTGDLVHDGRQLQRLTGLEAIEQDLRSRLSFFQGEWFLDEQVGVPYFQTLLGSKLPIPAVKEVFRGVIISTPGVADITRLEVKDGERPRDFVVSFTVSTDLGEISLAVETGV